MSDDAGARIERALGFARDEQAYVRGMGVYTDDVRLGGEAHGHVLRSPHAHAALRRVDAERARRAPGVLCVVTGADLAGHVAPLPCMMPLPPGPGRAPIEAGRAVLAVDRVRHVGDGVAFVVAETLAAAMDAAELIEVDYEPLPAFVDPRATPPGGPPIWSDAPDNVCFRWRFGDAHATGDAFARAAHVVRLHVRNQRIVVNALEPRAAIGAHEPSAGRDTLISNTQGGHFIRRVLARSFGRPEDAFRVVTPNVGGSFGSRIFAYPEQALVLWAARLTGRTVRWCEDRREAFQTDTQARDHHTEAALALDAECRFLALSIDTIVGLGAYLSQYTPFTATTCGAAVQTGAYRVGAVDVRVTGVFTNTVPIDAYRGAGRPEANYALERLIDHAARQLGVDRAELRARNLPGATRARLTTTTGLEVAGGQFADNQRRCLAAADYAGFEARRAESWRHGRVRGFGFANYLEANGGLAVSRVMDESLPRESAAVHFLPEGGVRVTIGTESSGQDHARPVALLVARGLGLDAASIEVTEGDTAALRVGGGTGGSKSLLTSSVAATRAVEDVLARGRALLAVRWGVAPDAIACDAGVFRAGDRACSVLELARSAPGTLDVESVGALHEGSSANGCHAAEVEIDPETGTVEIVAYTAVDDFGTVVNEPAVEGQVYGGLAQGLGQALLEEGVYDRGTGQLLTGSLSEYTVARAIHVPNITWIDNGLPLPANALGAKACAESAASAAPPAIMNAIVDALAGYAGADDLQMPARPESVLARLRAGQRG